MVINTNNQGEYKMSNTYPRHSQHKGNVNNFKKTEKIQVRYGNEAEWEDYTKLLGSRQILEMQRRALILFGRENVRLVKVA